MGLGARKDGVDLMEKWKEQKSKQYSNDRKYKFVDTVQALNEVDANEVDHLFGLFNVWVDFGALICKHSLIFDLFFRQWSYNLQS